MNNDPRVQTTIGYSDRRKCGSEAAIGINRQNRPAPGAPLRQQVDPISSRSWSAYFRRNGQMQMHIPWHRGGELTDIEKSAVCRSIQVFQLGEDGEGEHFIKVARRYAENTKSSDDLEYVAALRLFISEERRHAAYLGRFLGLNGVSCIKREWSDGIFRWLRHRAGLELVIAVLITAEIIARVYYAALRCSTKSGILKRICEQLLRDEVMHVRFQAERLARIRRRHSRFHVKISSWLQRILFSTACLVVWKTHRSALRAGGFGLTKFWRRSHAEFTSTMRLMDPSRYRFESRTAVGESARSIQRNSRQLVSVRS